MKFCKECFSFQYRNKKKLEYIKHCCFYVIQWEYAREIINQYTFLHFNFTFVHGKKRFYDIYWLLSNIQSLQHLNKRHFIYYVLELILFHQIVFFLLTQHLHSGNDVQKYCSCATEASNGDTHLQELPDHHAAVCNITSSLVDCSQQQTPSLFLTTCNRVGHDGRKRRALSEDGLNTRSKRVRRSTTDSDDVVDFSPISYDPAFNTSFIPPVSL